MKHLLFSLCAIFLAVAAWASDPDAQLWIDLDHSDAAIRTAAREKIEGQPLEQWLPRVYLEHRSWAALELITAAGNRVPKNKLPEVTPHICELFMTLRLEQMNELQMKTALSVSQMIFEKMQPGKDQKSQMMDVWKSLATHSALPVTERNSIAAHLDWLKKFGQSSQK